VTVRYPAPPQFLAPFALDAGSDWEPRSLLQVLFVLKQLEANWGSDAIAQNRLDILNDLTQFLLRFLADGPPHNPPVPVSGAGSDPLDTFVIDALTVMKDVSVVWDPASTKPTRIDKATVEAPGASANNSACVTGTDPRRSCEIALVLTRNESFLQHAANDLLIYQCPPVEWPGGCPVQNLWRLPLKFTPGGLNLQDALTAFFDGLLHKADLSKLNLEAGISTYWRKGRMDTSTAVALLPVDLKPTAGGTTVSTAQTVASFVYAQYVAFLGQNTPGPAGTDASGIRLRVKITAPDKASSPRGAVVLEIPSIDFPF
jgi:hypothetical protein